MSEIKSSIVTLQPGMFILRHSKDGLAPLSISRAPSQSLPTGKIESLSTPKTQGAMLYDGSDCIVMHISEASVNLLVTAYLAQADDPVPSLRIDQIGLDVESPQLQVSKLLAMDAPIEISDKGLSIIGHIERTGEVVASANQCLGDPTSNLRLEGFQVMWPDRPEGVDLAYSVSLEGIGSTPIVNSGNFCGTRQEARRITEIMFALIGPQAKQFELKGTAYFSGGFQMSLLSGMALSGPSGLEHLIAINLSINPATPKEKNVKNPWEESSQTKVFKAKVKEKVKSKK